MADNNGSEPDDGSATIRLLRLAKLPRTKCSNTRGRNMKRECDFAKAARGKFYRKGAELRLPIYLDSASQRRRANR
jgi:hypothetical protein